MNDIFQGIIGAYADRHHEEQKNLMTEEINRRKSLSEFWMKKSEDPNDHPEARDIAMQKYLQISQTPFNKKLPKELESLDDWLQVKPKAGQSLQTGSQQQSKAQEVARPAMEGSMTPQSEDYGAVTRDAWGMGEAPNPPPSASNYSVALPPTQLPEYSIEAPTPPPNYTIPHGITESERITSAQRVADMQNGMAEQRAYSEAQAKGRYENSPENIAGVKARADAARAPAPPPQFRTRNRTDDLYNDATGEVTSKGVPPPVPPDNTLSDQELYLKANGGDAVKAIAAMEAAAIKKIQAGQRPDTSISEMELYLKANGNDPQKAIAAKQVDEIARIQAQKTPTQKLAPGELSGMAQYVIGDPSALRTMTATDKGKVYNELGNNKIALQSMARNFSGKAMQTIDDLKSMPGKDAAIGAKGWASGFGIFGEALAGTAERDYAMRVESLIAQVVLPNLDVLRGLGQMSDTEFNTLKAASTSLNRNMSQAAFDKELDRIYAAMKLIRDRPIGYAAPAKLDGKLVGSFPKTDSAASPASVPAPPPGMKTTIKEIGGKKYNVNESGIIVSEAQ